MTTIPAGRRANLSGQGAEGAIAAVLDRQGHIYGRQVPIGHGIYDTPLRVDFLVHGVPAYPNGLIFESKWQDVSGSVDEKFPYLVANIKECYPCPAIIILSGNGYRPGAERWLRGQVGGNLLAVYSLDQFLSWVFRLSR